MHRTLTPELDGEVTQRLQQYADLFRDDFPRVEQSRLVGPYLRGLMGDGQRKSIEPLVSRLDGWEALGLSDPVQAVRHFVGHGLWHSKPVMTRYRALMAAALGSPDGAFIIDDTANLKQGRHSVGVQRQYCGSIKTTANCQVSVTVHYVSARGHCPLALRLFLPESWTGDPKRLDEGKVPLEYRAPKTKLEIALELLDEVLAEGFPGRTVLADAFYGTSAEFRRAIVQRQLRYAVGVSSDVGVFTEEPEWVEPRIRRRKRAIGRHPCVPRLARHCRSVSVVDAAKDLPVRQCAWREGTKGKLRRRFGRTRVWPARGAYKSHCLGDLEQEQWLLVEERHGGRRYYLSNFPESAALIELVRSAMDRWPVELGYRQLKQDLGFNHFEGRRWAGFHHHTCLVFLAFGFLELERLRQTKRSRRKSQATAPEKKAEPGEHPLLHAHP